MENLHTGKMSDRTRDTFIKFIGIQTNEQMREKKNGMV